MVRPVGVPRDREAVLADRGQGAVTWGSGDFARSGPNSVSGTALGAYGHHTVLVGASVRPMMTSSSRSTTTRAPVSRRSPPSVPMGATRQQAPGRLGGLDDALIGAARTALGFRLAVAQRARCRRLRSRHQRSR